MTIHSEHRRMFTWRARVSALLALTLPLTAWPQAAAPVARGLYNWVHTTGDAEKAFAFYRDTFGIELTASPFVGTPNAAPEGIRPVSQAGSDELVWDLTNTRGSRFRTVFMRAANTPFGLELSEFFDIPRDTRTANPWDPGASTLIFEVRDLNAIVTRLTAGGAPVVTLGDNPLDTPAGRSILVRDPDGYLVQVTQASPSKISNAAPGDVIGTSIGISVRDLTAALAFYQGLLGFEVGATRRATQLELRLHGLADGELTQTTTSIAQTAINVLFSEFKLPATATPPPQPFRWKIQDVGAPQFQLQVAGLDELLERTHAAGYRFLSVGARPIQRPFGRFVFAIDDDGVLVEYVEPSAQ
jgi:catechol 2,3-dioxygenase-like lactoylglutathione lyase family enzyme